MATSTSSVQPILSEAQRQRAFQAACRVVAATVSRHTPPDVRPLLGDACAVGAFGVFVTLRRAGQLRACCGFLDPEARLETALAQAARRAARDDPRFPPIDEGELPELHVDVWVLWGQEPVPAVGEQRAAAVVIGRHGLQIARNGQRGLLLPGVAVEHRLNSRQFLEQVSIKAGLPPSAWKEPDTQLWTFEGFAIEGMFDPEALGPGATGSPAVRPPAVHGTFYPGDAVAIERTLEGLMPDFVHAAPWAAALVPHAGWIYSGRLAAATLSHISFPRTVIVFCPRHRPQGAPWAVAPYEAWGLPGGEVPGDPQLARKLAHHIPGLYLDAAAHENEHAIEVLLPMLSRLAPDSRVVGIAVGGGKLPDLLTFGDALAEELGGLSELPLLLISSDMSHFAEDSRARELDKLALDALETLDPVQLYETVRHNQISMCGMLGAVIVVHALRRLNRLSRFELVGYTTSADVTNDTSKVVGYAGALLGR